jgi:hypothetical protein
MKRFKALVVILAVFLLAGGCAGMPFSDDVWMVDLQSAMGGLNGQPDIQQFDYQFALSHREDHTFRNVSISLLINNHFIDRVEERKGQLEIALPYVYPLEHIKLFGQLTLDTANLTKEQIDGMGPVIAGVRIKWTDGDREFQKVETFR